MSDTSRAAEIREADRRDAPALTELTDELGYASGQSQLRARLERLLAHPDAHAVFVAEDVAGSVVGWLHCCVAWSLESDPYVEIRGLVVGVEHRGAGIGRRLVQRAEQWARRRDIGQLRVRSNVVRERAHHFYERLGFSRIKSQVVLVRNLE